MIAKIESGERLPDEARIPVIAESLGLNASDLAQAASRLDRRKASGPKIVDAMKLAKRNDERARALRARAERLKHDVDSAAADLREKVREFDAKVLEPVSSLLSRIDEIPPEAVIHASVEEHHRNPEFSKSLRAAQRRTGESVHALLRAGILEGEGAAVQLSGIASASTGFVVMNLSRVPSTWSTLAEIMTLAAPAVGATAGKGVTTAIAVLPVALAVNALVTGGRVLSTQQEIQRQLEGAEAEFRATEQVATEFIGRATRIGEILTVALFAARNHIRTIDGAIPAVGRVTFESLGAAAEGSVRRMTEVVFACLTVLALPIGLNLVKSVDDDAGVDLVGEETIAQIQPAFEVGSKLENEFIDYVIDVAFGQVAH